jgi:7-keto-8-aminopelargonate synthetase-like enzyme
LVANAGTVAALLGKDDLIPLRRLNHASIIDGARLSCAAIRVSAPRRPSPGEASRRRPTKRRPVITDGVFSMDGDIAPMPQIAALARSTERS